VNEKLGSSLVISGASDSASGGDGAQGEIVGIVTARDLLKFIHQHQLLAEEEGVGSGSGSGNASNRYTVADAMTPAERLIYCSPLDSVRRCREIMFQNKVRNLPVIAEVSAEDHDGKRLRHGQKHFELRGLVTMKMIADSSFSLAKTGGKKGFIYNVTGRRGLPQGTVISEDVIRRAERERQLTALDMEFGSFCLPHPFKRADGGVAMSRRLYGAHELSSEEDLSVCEDAHFAVRANDQVYLCVADGVGSWRQHGVDPRDYSHRLVENALKLVKEDAHHREIMGHSPLERGE
jgi:protein phosphatase PTC7